MRRQERRLGRGSVRGRRSKLGFTLVEVVVSLGVLGIGALATLQLISVMISSNRTISANTDAMALANRLIAEISDARYISTADFDPGLALGVHTVAAAGSGIQTVGLFNPHSPAPMPQPLSTGDLPAYTVSYEVVQCTVCTNPYGGAGGGGVGGIEVLVEVDNWSVFRPGQSRLMRPLHMVLRKEYNASAAEEVSQIRGFAVAGGFP